MNERQQNADKIAIPTTERASRVRWMYGRLAEFFVMREQFDRAEGEALRPGHPGFWEARVASELLESAEVLEGIPARALGQMSLLRESMLFSARSLCRQRSLTDHRPDLAEVWRLATAQSDVQTHLVRLSTSEREALDRFVVDGLAEACAEANGVPVSLRPLAAVARVLVSRSESTVVRVSELRKRRTLRWILVASTLLALTALAVSQLHGQARRRNLALRGTVALSSYRYAAQFPPTRLVDGDKSKLGCRVGEDGPWAQIDLGNPKTIRRVVVTNHADAAPLTPLPLVIELSEDGTSFTELARRTEAFSTWSEHKPPTAARFVRVRLLVPGMLELDEIEVY